MTNLARMFQVCSGPCGRELPATREHFYAMRTCASGLARQCKECHGAQSTAAARRRHEENPERFNEQAAARQLRHKRRNGVPPKRYLTPEEKITAKQKYNDRYKTQPGVFEKYLVTHARIRNEKYHPETPFDLTSEWVQQQFAAQEGRCFWFHVPMRLRHSGGPWQVSLDRLDLGTGYTQSNVVLTSKSANMGRMATAVGDFELFIDDVRSSMRIP